MKIQALLASALTAISLAVSPVCAATSDRTKGFWSDGDLLLKTSLYTRHYSNDPRHTNHQRMINLEWIADDDYGPPWTDRAFAHSPRTRWLVGAAAFRNSFGQQSTMLYGGFRRELTSVGHGRTYVKLTGGLLHGYRGEFRDKIPFNQLGVAPVVLPAIGVDYRRMSLELIPFGTAGLMISIGLYPF